MMFPALLAAFRGGIAVSRPGDCVDREKMATHEQIGELLGRMSSRRDARVHLQCRKRARLHLAEWLRARFRCE